MTAAQKQASNPNHSVWVTANAGTGKTKVLTDRVLRLLLEGANAGSILCLTFTKAAAGEMQNRIHEKLAGWAILDETALSQAVSELIGMQPSAEILQRAKQLFLNVLDAPDGLKIQTIHGFCQSLMSRFPMEANVPPYFQVIDEQTADELLEEARMRLLYSIQQEENAQLRGYIESLACRVADSSFGELLKAVVNKRQELMQAQALHGSTEGVIQAIYQTLDVEGLTSELVRQRFCQEENFDGAGLRQAAMLLERGGKKDKDRALIMQQWLAASEQERVELLNGYIRQFIKSDMIEPLQSLMQKALADKYPEIAEALYTEQDRVLRYLDKIKAIAIAENTAKLLHIAYAVIGLYEQLKKNRAFLDYQDLIVISNRLLSKEDVAPWILYKLDSGIDHILVDEAQDTSPAQWQLVDVLTREFFAGSGAKDTQRTLFVVGDEKQSIYSFQGADPRVFAEKQLVMQERVLQASQRWYNIGLDRSFRSTEAVLGLVDKVFSEEERRASVSQIAEDISHAAHRVGHGGRVEIWPRIKQPEKAKKEPWELPLVQKATQDINAKHAEAIARQVKQWLDEKRILPAKGRSIEPKDVLLLVRKRGEVMGSLVKAFKQAGIPIGGLDKIKLKDNLAVMDLIALGNFLLMPEGDLTLAVILRSPLVGLSENDLFALCYGRGDESLWSRLLKSSHKEAAALLRDLLNKVDYSSPFALFSYVLDVVGGRKKLAQRMGEEVYEPLDEFVSMALDYERSHSPSLQGFLHWFNAGDAEIKREAELGASQNMVRIMTTHGSKGLQAPVVIIADATAPLVGGKADALLQDDNGLIFWASNQQERTNYCQTIVDKKKLAAKQESLRLLYVAMTRAEDELYIAGWEYDKTMGESWYDIVLSVMQQEGEEVVSYFSGEEDKGYVIAHEHVAETKSQVSSYSQQADVVLPAWIAQHAPEEPVPSMPLTPSRPSEAEPTVDSPLIRGQHDFLRGTVIHKLLQYLPNVEEADRAQRAADFLQRYANDFNEKQAEEMKRSVLAILQDERFKYLFGENSQAEVPIAGCVGDFVLSGQIDRLVVLEDEVLIVDYKTHRQPPTNEADIPQAYKKQMASYSKALAGIYPDKQIRCFLLWTETPCVMEVSGASLASKTLLEAAG